MSRLLDVLTRLGLRKQLGLYLEASNGELCDRLHKPGASFKMVRHISTREHFDFDGGDYFADPTFAKGRQP